MIHDFRGNSECVNLFSKMAKVLSEALNSALDCILSDFSEWSARSLFAVFASMGPAGIAGLQQYSTLVRNSSTTHVREKFKERVSAINLPVIGRKVLTESKIETYHFQ